MQLLRYTIHAGFKTIKNKNVCKKSSLKTSSPGIREWDGVLYEIELTGCLLTLISAPHGSATKPTSDSFCFPFTTTNNNK